MIRIRQLTKKYGNKTAVDNLTLEIHPGVVTGFLGPNGAGKSTTLRMILGLTAPTAGEVLVDGQPYARLKTPLAKIGALLDASAVNPQYTARQHLQLIASAGQIAGERVAQLLAATGLQSAADQAIEEFSFGMRQRLGIAGALLGDPETLILDEPFNGLDVDGIKWLRDLTRQLAAQGKAVLISSHLMSEVQEIAGRVIVLAQGKLIADMGMAEMSAGSLSAYIRVKTDQTGLLRAALERQGAVVQPVDNGELRVRSLEMQSIGEIAWQNKIALHELSKHQPSLEQLFSELTQGRAAYSSSAGTHISEGK
jgi:ABC-2 type transport system ATP-binding protein